MIYPNCGSTLPEGACLCNKCGYLLQKIINLPRKSPNTNDISKSDLINSLDDVASKKTLKPLKGINQHPKVIIILFFIGLVLTISSIVVIISGGGNVYVRLPLGLSMLIIGVIISVFTMASICGENAEICRGVGICNACS